MLRCYLMVARPGEEATLGAALVTLAEAVRRIDGNEGIELLVDQDDPARFTFLERWRDRASYEAGSKHLPKILFGPVLAVLAEPPQASKLDPILSL